jgi:hypothetical protein
MASLTVENPSTSRKPGPKNNPRRLQRNTVDLFRNGAVGFIDWLDASVATSIDVRGNWRSNWRELCDVCNLLVIQAHPTKPNGSLNNVALNLTRRHWRL